MPWKLVEFIWRRKYENNQWQAIINCLKEISFKYNNENTPRISYLTEVLG